MKLVPPAHANSFYETFSDLIFCTLILFVLMVMALVTQVRTTVDPMVSPGEYTGATGRTRVFVAFVPLPNDTTGVAFIESALAVDALLARNAQRDPLLELCRLVAGGNPPKVLEADRFVALAAGVTTPTADGILSLAEMSAALTLLVHLQATRPEIARDASALRRALCGSAMALTATSVAPDLRNQYDQWRQWAAALASSPDQVHSRHAETVAPLRRATRSADGAPRITFHPADESTIRVGEASLSRDEFTALLAAIDPGRGFRVECVDAAGNPTVPPDWVVHELLAPVGFDARAVANAAPAGQRPSTGAPTSTSSEP